MNIQDDPTTKILSRLLDATAMRNKVLANNIANSDTPNFTRQDVPFEAELASAVRSGNIDGFAPKIQADRATPARADGNNVAVDRELAELNKNAMMHQMAIQLMQQKLSMQRIAITGHT